MIISIAATFGSTIPHIGRRVSQDFLAKLLAEPVKFDSGKVWITLTARNFHGRRRVTKISKQLTRGRLILTSGRTVVLAGKWVVVDLEGPAREKLKIDCSDPQRFNIIFELADFHSDMRGEITLSFHIDPNKIIKI